jgi:hypothetical protein
MTTANLKGRPPFPDPIAVLSIPSCEVFRAVDAEGQPILVLSDGVTTVALECGLRGLTDEVVAKTRRLADGVTDYYHSVAAAKKIRRH